MRTHARLHFAYALRRRLQHLRMLRWPVGLHRARVSARGRRAPGCQSRCLCNGSGLRLPAEQRLLRNVPRQAGSDSSADPVWRRLHRSPELRVYQQQVWHRHSSCRFGLRSGSQLVRARPSVLLAMRWTGLAGRSELQSQRLHPAGVHLWNTYLSAAAALNRRRRDRARTPAATNATSPRLREVSPLTRQPQPLSSPL